MKYAMQARAEGVSSTAGEILYEAMQIGRAHV